MRKIAIVTIGIAMILVSGCRKNNSTSGITSETLKTTEAFMNQDYSQAQQYEKVLKDRHTTTGMTMTDTTCKRYDSMYHMQDTSFSMHLHQYCLEMMKMSGMDSNGMMGGSGGMMGGSGGMMCNMDSMMMAMNGMMNMNTFKMDSMMMVHMTNCPAMGSMPNTMQNLVNNMQAVRKEHMSLHK